MFVFIHPIQAQSAVQRGLRLSDITYEFALSEITRHAGLDIEDGENYSALHWFVTPCRTYFDCLGDKHGILCCFRSEEVLLQQDVMSMMQIVQDVNAMAEDLNKHITLSIVLVSAEARGLESGRAEVKILYLK